MAHHTGGCTADSCAAGQEIECGGDGDPSNGSEGKCTRTTGRAPYCADNTPRDCAACQTDAECQAALGRPDAACVVCPRDCPETTTICLQPAAGP